jgi:phospholipid/cholesterol/gamma-HCH transport system substrate-binding protein
VILRRTKVQLAIFGLVAVLGILFTGGRYAGLGAAVPGHDPGFLVKADFVDSGGVFKGAEVTYRGVPVGKVESLELPKDSDGILVHLRLKPGTKVPSPTKAFVANRSAVGEQYVDLQPQNDGTTYLHDGDVIPRSRTAIPIQPTQLVVNLDKLVRSIDVADVTTVLDELGRAFDGSAQDLQRLIDAGDALTETATQNLPQTLKLIEDSKPVLETQRQLASSFKSYNRDLAALSAQLRSSDPDFRKLFQTGTDSARETVSFLEANRAKLPVLLQNLVFVAQVQNVRIPAIRQILTTYPNIVAGGFTVTPGDGTAHFGFVFNQDAQPCPASDPGYAGTPRRDPADVTPRQSRLTAYCSKQSPSPQTVRGARNVPRGSDRQAPYPEDRKLPNNQASLYAGASSTDAYTAGYRNAVADYDPSSGHAITADGQQFTIGSAALADRALGADAWKWVLLDPLRRW